MRHPQTRPGGFPLPGKCHPAPFLAAWGRANPDGRPPAPDMDDGAPRALPFSSRDGPRKRLCGYALARACTQRSMAAEKSSRASERVKNESHPCILQHVQTSNTRNMARMTILPGMDRFNRILTCRDTFLVEIAREALGLAQFDPSPLQSFLDDMDLVAKTARKGRLTYGFGVTPPPMSPVVKPACHFLASQCGFRAQPTCASGRHSVRPAGFRRLCCFVLRCGSRVPFPSFGPVLCRFPWRAGTSLLSP